MALKGTVEAEVELKSPAEKFYKIWRSEAHKLPEVTSTNIQAVKVHEGDWGSHGAVKIWNYTVEGKSGVFKSKVEFDDANLTVTLHGLEGDVYDEYKVYRPVCRLIRKEKGSLAKLSIEYEKHKASDPNPDKYLAFFISMTKDIDVHASKCTVEAEVELKSPAEKFYKIWRSEAHKLPDVTSTNIQAVKVHEGDWDSHGAIKIWNYTVEGKSGVFKEKVEFDDANLTVTLHGVEGDIYDEYKVYRPVCKLIRKEKGSLAKLSIEYEKYKESDPNPDKYLAFFISMTKDIDVHASTT